MRVRILLPLPVEKALKVLILQHFEGFFVYENFQQISVQMLKLPMFVDIGVRIFVRILTPVLQLQAPPPHFALL